MKICFHSLWVVLSLLFIGCSVSPEDKANVLDANTTLTRPNIVFILADDLGWHQLGCYGSEYYETPVLDQMAREGLRFTDAYAAQAVCSPTRASIMTGKYPARLHLTNFLNGGDVPKSQPLPWTGGEIKFPKPQEEIIGEIVIPATANRLKLEEITIAEQLKMAGYVTGHFGKWHLNYNKIYQPGRPGDPGSQGFDEVLTTHKVGAGPVSTFENDPLHVRQITEHALSFIEAHQDEPFFAYVTHNSIHRPEEADTEVIDRFSKKQGAKAGASEEDRYDHNNPKQAAMLLELDTSIGKIFDKLKELDLDKNTLVIFVSDNGHLGVKDGFPLRGSKADLYEGGIRVPMIVRWPGRVEEGSVSAEPVITTDFFPTLNEIVQAGKLPENVDGLSLVPILKNSDARLGREALYFHFPHDHSSGLGPMSVVREGLYKLVEFSERLVSGKPGAYELYDLETDLAEKNDLAASHPEVVQRLTKKLQQWRVDIGAQEVRRNENPKRK